MRGAFGRRVLARHCVYQMRDRKWVLAEPDRILDEQARSHSAVLEARQSLQRCVSGVITVRGVTPY